ncbi:MAG: CPBP family intramembrane metalloprotease [Prevotellaceae bacterium]|jgi:membrane protease YdiL (CAAX protease family)|nr:CPBP family intramembrane metalloprotease [Prevotellaceae bacterium]
MAKNQYYPTPEKPKLETENELKTRWRWIFNFDWKLGLFLILIICIPRFFLVLQANALGSYGYIGLIMVISALLPFIFLTKTGQKSIGITKPKKYSALLLALLSGLGFSILLHYLGQFLYGSTFENWYAYIGQSYNIPAAISAHDKAVLFSITALTGMLFSPIGEELFFRGIVYSSFAKSVGGRGASTIESVAFAATHIAHFGLIFTGGKWTFLLMPTLIWVIGMFLASIMFLYFKNRSGSILGAVICHAAFNFGMIFCIFYMI